MLVTCATMQMQGGLRQIGAGLLLACGLATTLILAPRPMRAQSEAPTSFDHGAWDGILKKYVDADGLVAYKRLGDRDREQLDAYVASLADAKPQQMGEHERLAFWINAYNAGIVAAILGGHSPESALSRVQLFRWYTFRVAGEERTPNELEHEILRKEFREPRIHFALVCGATSCPKLRREAYRGDVLDQQLDDQARRFINDPARNRIDPDTGIRLSSIFDWFESDFAASRGSVADFIAHYLDDHRAEALRQSRDRIEFLDYDWTLNAQRASEAAEENVNGAEKKVCAIGQRARPQTAGEPSYCTGELNG